MATRRTRLKPATRYAAIVTAMWFCNVCGGTSACASSQNDFKSIFQDPEEGLHCRVSVRLEPDSIVATIFLADCQDTEADAKKAQNVGEIAKTMLKVIKENSLETEIRSRGFVYINIGWKVDNFPVISAINNDATWPSDVFKALRTEYPDTQQRQAEYKARLGRSIVQAYSPLVDAFGELGCALKLSDNFADPLLMRDGATPRSILVDQGIFDSRNARKSLYPTILGPIAFKLQCELRK